jgi:hypothetical protein
MDPHVQSKENEFSVGFHFCQGQQLGFVDLTFLSNFKRIYAMEFYSMVFKVGFTRRDFVENSTRAQHAEQDHHQNAINSFCQRIKIYLCASYKS